MCEWIVATDSLEYRAFAGFGSRSASVQFRLRPIFWHVIGKALPFKHILATTREKCLTQCGRSFAPDVYLAVGPLTYVVERTSDEAITGFRVALDCGISLDIGFGDQRPPLIRRGDLTPGTWIAALGHLCTRGSGVITPVNPPVALTELKRPSEIEAFFNRLKRTTPAPIPPAEAEFSKQLTAVECHLKGAMVHDLRPLSETFGSIIPWDLSDPPPHDPDIISLSSMFLILRAVTCE